MRLRHRLVPLLLLASCGGEEENQEPAQAAALLRRVEAEDYRNWERAPGYETRKPARSPHSSQVDIFVNDVVAAALAAGEPLDAWPVGSTIVKDGFAGDALELVAIMDKRDDGWFWAEYFGGKAKYSGSPSVCTDCHSGGEDHVLAFPLP